MQKGERGGITLFPIQWTLPFPLLQLAMIILVDEGSGEMGLRPSTHDANTNVRRWK